MLDRLRDPTRDHWLVPVSPSGNTDDPDLEIKRVRKGANTPEIEASFYAIEREMVRALSGLR